MSHGRSSAVLRRVQSAGIKAVCNSLLVASEASATYRRRKVGRAHPRFSVSTWRSTACLRKFSRTSFYPDVRCAFKPVPHSSWKGSAQGNPAHPTSFSDAVRYRRSTPPCKLRKPRIRASTFRAAIQKAARDLGTQPRLKLNVELNNLCGRRRSAQRQMNLFRFAPDNLVHDRRSEVRLDVIHPVLRRQDSDCNSLRAAPTGSKEHNAKEGQQLHDQQGSPPS